MESNNIITITDNFEKIVFVIRVSGPDGWHNCTIPNDIYESRSFPSRPAKSTRLVERDNILLTSNGFKRLCWSECPWIGIGSIRRTKKTSSATGTCVGLVSENSCVEDSISWACTDPVGVTCSIAEKVAFATITFESSIDDIVYSFISSGISDC